MRNIGQILASQGQGGDSIVAHISPKEAMLLKMLGGVGSINPRTGLPQFFNPEEYLKLYSDVAANPYYAANPLEHWNKFGQAEGRQSGDAPANWDASAYLARNVDVAATGMDPLTHYNLHGRNEGRRWDIEGEQTGGLQPGPPAEESTIGKTGGLEPSPNPFFVGTGGTDPIPTSTPPPAAPPVEIPTGGFDPRDATYSEYIQRLEQEAGEGNPVTGQVDVGEWTKRQQEGLTKTDPTTGFILYPGAKNYVDPKTGKDDIGGYYIKGWNAIEGHSADPNSYGYVSPFGVGYDESVKSVKQGKDPNEKIITYRDGRVESSEIQTGKPWGLELAGNLTKGLTHGIIDAVAMQALGPLGVAGAEAGMGLGESGGDWGRAAMQGAIGGVTSYAGSALAPYVSSAAGAAGTTLSEPASQAISKGLVTTGAGLAQGQNTQQALASGLASGALAYAGGQLFNTSTGEPVDANTYTGGPGEVEHPYWNQPNYSGPGDPTGMIEPSELNTPYGHGSGLNSYGSVNMPGNESPIDMELLNSQWTEPLPPMQPGELQTYGSFGTEPILGPGGGDPTGQINVPTEYMSPAYMYWLENTGGSPYTESPFWQQPVDQSMLPGGSDPTQQIGVPPEYLSPSYNRWIEQMLQGWQGGGGPVDPFVNTEVPQNYGAFLGPYRNFGFNPGGEDPTMPTTSGTPTWPYTGPGPGSGAGLPWGPSTPQTPVNWNQLLTAIGPLIGGIIEGPGGKPGPGPSGPGPGPGPGIPFPGGTVSEGGTGRGAYTDFLGTAGDPSGSAGLESALAKLAKLLATTPLGGGIKGYSGQRYYT